MKLTTIVHPDRVEIRAAGRLDAAWADHFLEATRRIVREGNHRLRLDAADLEYISSAGLRSLLQTSRELAAVRGSFRIVRASAFVVQTLRMSGFDSLLALDEAPAAEPAPAAAPAAPPPGWTVAGATIETYPLAGGEGFTAARVGGWTPWAAIAPAACPEIELGAAQVALGVGSPGQGEDFAARLGDFLALAGCTAFLPGDGSEVPDYLATSGQYVPRLRVADALRASGSFTHLLRFQPADGGAPLALDRLLEGAFATTGARSVVAVVLGELDGLVGVSWARSPGLLTGDPQAAEFPAVREWLAFCGERVHGGELGLAVAFASTEAAAPGLPVSPAHPDRRVHAHAVVFPYRPLPNGPLDLAGTVQPLFDGPPPQALLHLVEDDRPALGLGRSAFVRGACWCAPCSFTAEVQS